MVNITKVTVAGWYSKNCGRCTNSDRNVFLFPEMTDAHKKALGLSSKQICAPCLGAYIRDGKVKLSIGDDTPATTDAEPEEERLHVNDEGEVSLTNAMGDTVEVSW